MESLIGVIAPSCCIECGYEGSALCDNCLSLVEPVVLSCYKCGAVSQTGICKKCKKQTRLDGVYPASSYYGATARLTRELKYGQNRSASVPMSKLIYQRTPKVDDCFITNVPTASNRVRARSFDHTQLIAKHFAGLSGLTYWQLLARIGSTRQVGAPKSIRSSQLIGMFWVTKPNVVAGKKIIIVDDVISTGATIDEVARVLKKAGAKKVIALSFAHKKLG